MKPNYLPFLHNSLKKSLFTAFFSISLNGACFSSEAEREAESFEKYMKTSHIQEILNSDAYTEVGRTSYTKKELENLVSDYKGDPVMMKLRNGKNIKINYYDISNLKGGAYRTARTQFTELIMAMNNSMKGEYAPFVLKTQHNTMKVSKVHDTVAAPLREGDGTPAHPMRFTIAPSYENMVKNESPLLKDLTIFERARGSKGGQLFQLAQINQDIPHSLIAKSSKKNKGMGGSKLNKKFTQASQSGKWKEDFYNEIAANQSKAQIITSLRQAGDKIPQTNVMVYLHRTRQTELGTPSELESPILSQSPDASPYNSDNEEVVCKHTEFDEKSVSRRAAEEAAEALGSPHIYPEESPVIQDRDKSFYTGTDSGKVSTHKGSQSKRARIEEDEV